MKSKNLNKLSLKKINITKLNKLEQNSIKGGSTSTKLTWQEGLCIEFS